VQRIVAARPARTGHTGFRAGGRRSSLQPPAGDSHAAFSAAPDRAETLSSMRSPAACRSGRSRRCGGVALWVELDAPLSTGLVLAAAPMAFLSRPGRVRGRRDARPSSPPAFHGTTRGAPTRRRHARRRLALGARPPPPCTAARSSTRWCDERGARQRRYAELDRLVEPAERAQLAHSGSGEFEALRVKTRPLRRLLRGRVRSRRRVCR
jgi:hypothetical protein